MWSVNCQKKMKNERKACPSSLFILILFSPSFISRQKRLAEMKVQATRNRYGTIIEIKVLNIFHFCLCLFYVSL